MKLKREWNNAADDWALVTGGGSGIGLAISERLASMGYNLLIVSIDPRLDETAERLAGKFGVRTLALGMNLAKRESADRLHQWCASRGIEPVILVNNAGIFIYNDIVATDADRMETMINLHVLTTSLLSRLFAADMAKRGRGYILNMSSYSAWMPWPGIAVYGATKSYIRHYSRALAAELRRTGVVATAALPAGVTTGLYGLSERLLELGRKSGLLLTPQRTAELSLSAMFRGKKQYVPGLPMRLMLPLVKALPGWAVRLARRKTMRYQRQGTEPKP